MASTVDRTFVISFKAVPNKPRFADISNFIVQKLNFALPQIKHLQITNGRVYVGTESPEIAQNMVQEHNMKHQLEHDGKLYPIPLFMEDGTIEVRIHDLRPRINNQQLVQRMKEFGKISSIREETWKDFFPGVPNGVRVLRMRLTKPIPSYITVDTEMTLVTYRWQVATCKHCHRNVHYTQTCAEYAKSLRPSVNERLTMAEVVKNPSAYDDPTQAKKAKLNSTSQDTTNPSDQAEEKQQLQRTNSNISLVGSDISISSAEVDQEAELSRKRPVDTPTNQTTPMYISDTDSPNLHDFPSMQSIASSSKTNKQNNTALNQQLQTSTVRPPPCMPTRRMPKDPLDQ